MLTKAYALQGGTMSTPEAAESFADAVQIAEWAQASVNAAHALGLIQGRGQGEFAPAAYLTRAEAAQIIYKLVTK